MVYGDAQPAGKAKFLAELSIIFQDSVNLILIGEDFNIIRKASEKTNLVPQVTGVFFSMLYSTRWC